MINKSVAWITVFVVFLLSAVVSYSFFGNGSLTTGAGFLAPLTKYAAPSSQATPTATNEPKTEECPLNGEMLTKTQKNQWVLRRPMGVAIENHKEARPQSGLSSADVVYEAVAEGGITRFLAVFYCKDATTIGPVRSARIYFIKLLEQYGDNPLYVHVGGANTPGPADALGYINTLDWNSYNDLNQFSVPFPYFWRDYERLPNVATEHTVYSSTVKLWKYAKDVRKLTNVDSKGVAWDKNFKAWSFKDDASQGDRGKVAKIDFGFWTNLSSDFSVTWTYNSVNNTYARNNGGVAHIDKDTGKQLTAKNIVIMFSKETPANDGYEGGHIIYKTIGSGDAIIFQNGQAIKGSWSRVFETDPLKFTDESGKAVSMVRGQVFVEVLPIGNKVNY